MRAPSTMQLNEVRFAYHRRQRVIDRITATVEPGRLHVLLGPNAAGKSTLIKLMLGHLRPNRGRVLLGRRRVHRLGAAKRARWLAYVPQRASLTFAFTVRQVVEMGRFALPRDPRAVDYALEQCELIDLQDRPHHELSVGQQQRVLLARAMAQAGDQGRVMLLDEPTSAMDLAHLHLTMTLLKRLTAGGLAVVAVVQDLNLASRYADRIWLMQEGRLVADGEWFDVMRPAILEPVYGVKLRTTVRSEQLQPGGPRPVFDARLPDTAA